MRFSQLKGPGGAEIVRRMVRTKGFLLLVALTLLPMALLPFGIRVVEQKTEQGYAAALRQEAARQGNAADELLDSVALVLSESTSNIRYIDVGRTEQADPSLEAGLACAELNRVTEMYPLIKSAYLVCNLNHTIYNSVDSNSYTQEEFYDLSWSQQYYSSQGGLQLLDTLRAVRTPANIEDYYVTMVSRVPYFSTLQNKCLVFNINIRELAEALLQPAAEDAAGTAAAGMRLMIYNSKGERLYSQSDYLAPDTIDQLGLQTAQQDGGSAAAWQHVTINDIDYMAVVGSATAYGWVMIQLLPYSTVKQERDYYTALLAGAAGFGSLMGLLAVLLGAYRRQRSILLAGQQVYQASGEDITDEESGLGYLQRVCCEKSEALRRSETVLNAFSGMLEQNVVLTLIDGNPIHKDDLPAYRETMRGMKLLAETPQSYIVMVVRVEAITTLKMNLHQDIYSKFRRILQYSCSQQLLEDFHACYAWTDIQTMVGILCYSAAIQNRQVKLALEQMGAAIQKQLTLLSERPVTIAFGDSMADPWQLVQSYSHAKQLIQHKIYYHKERPYTYQDMVETDIRMNYDRQKQLIDQIKLGRVQETSELLESYFSVLHANPYVELEQMRSICMELAEAIKSALGESVRSADPRFADIQALRQRMAGLSTVHEVADCLMEYAQAEARAMLEQLQKKKDSRVQAALDWIESNYTADISLDDVARQMELSPTYASKQIKAYTGQSVVNYINQVRIEHAKELLASTKMSSNEISAYVGFRYSQSFIRTFRKTVGMTPGNYRSLYRKKGGAAAAEAAPASPPAPGGGD